MKGKGVNNLSGFPDSSPSPRPSPLKGEGVFLTLYESIRNDEAVKSEISPAHVSGHPGRWNYLIKRQLDSGFRRNDGSFLQLRHSFSRGEDLVVFLCLPGCFFITFFDIAIHLFFGFAGHHPVLHLKAAKVPSISLVPSR